jgi:hypothetical protein
MRYVPTRLVPSGFRCWRVAYWLFHWLFVPAVSRRPLSRNALCDPLKKIRGRDMKVGEFNSHLKDFTTPERGSILQASGESYKRRYRFADPLMQPFVIIKSVTDGLIPLQSVPSPA